MRTEAGGRRAGGRAGSACKREMEGLYNRHATVAQAGIDGPEGHMHSKRDTRHCSMTEAVGALHVSVRFQVMAAIGFCVCVFVEGG